ncbi:MAG: hypothetical protein HQL31_03685 [Planctomycetes bacterium]|nr:hypothetical protein [Planctomycetota bacterium]
MDPKGLLKILSALFIVLFAGYMLILSEDFGSPEQTSQTVTPKNKGPDKETARPKEAAPVVNSTPAVENPQNAILLSRMNELELGLLKLKGENQLLKKELERLSLMLL